MPQAIKRFYGAFEPNTTYTTVYTCPANTIAKVQVNALTISSGNWGIHTSTSSSNAYMLLGATQYETNLNFTGFGNRLVLQSGNYNYFECFPVTQSNVGNISKLNFKEDNEGRNEYTAGTNTLKSAYKNEWYMSPSQKLFFYAKSTGGGYYNGYDFLIIEEAGS